MARDTTRPPSRPEPVVTPEPSGDGPVLARNREWRGELRAAALASAALLALLLLCDALNGTLDGPRAGCWCALGLALLLVLYPPRVTAGKGWLAARGPLRERRVRTDLLTRVTLAEGMAPRLVLGDVRGRRVEIDAGVLRRNPLIWHELDAAARRSRERGLLRGGETLEIATAPFVHLFVARGSLELEG
ncbi:hypothetical protein, partial [Streptomyces sp. URMC 123]|uniref:hypothetical protein n=1 Tax=Streptomyces sp. URMC 123 TaxID=3423403 RepID=UPI003F1A3729